MKKVPVKELISWILIWGETIDPHDITLLYAWLYSSYLALEPFPSAHCQYRKRCLDSFDLPGRRLRTARSILKSALKKAEGPFEICARHLSADYAMILSIFLRHDSKKTEQS